MNIAFAFDEGYAEHVAVAVESVLQTQPHGLDGGRTSHGRHGGDQREQGGDHQREHGLAAQREHGGDDQRDHGMVAQREHGVAAQREHGVAAQREHGVAAQHRGGVTLWLLTTDEVLAEHADAWRAQVAGRARLRLLRAPDEFRSWGRSSRESLGYISAGAYLRLVLPGMLPSDLDRVLYLDTDVLVCGDLSPLWELPLGAAVLAATRDHFTETMGTRGGIPGAPTTVDARAPYFNSGVLLINLPVWRAAGVTEACLAYLSANRDRLRLPDQDALNLAAHGRWHELPEIWNDHVTWWNPYADLPDTRILHFLGPHKPWQPGFQFHAAREQYERLLAVTRGGLA